jgi:hypothetical protein
MTKEAETKREFRRLEIHSLLEYNDKKKSYPHNRTWRPIGL